MHRLFCLILFLPCFLGGCNQRDQHRASTKKPAPRKSIYNDNHVDIKIPSAWIEKVRGFDYKHNGPALLREFDGYLKPDSLFIPHYNKDVDKKKDGLINPIFADLDGDAGQELVCLMGWDGSYPAMAVFKQINTDWHLIYLETFYMFYSEPELELSNSFSKNKTFYFRRVYERGSGVYSDGYSFYKIINGKVYKCLELPYEAHIYGWGLVMNQDIKMNFKFDGRYADQISVQYHYKFFPGAVNDGDCEWCANDKISLVEGEDGLSYQWDDKKRIYKLDVDTSKVKTGELTDQKIACFGSFGNDSLFVSAYRKEIDEKLKTGTALQKRILRQYLATVKKDKQAVTSKMEETTQADGTSFYRPKEK